MDYIVGSNCILKHIFKGKREDRIEAMGRW